MKQEKLDTNRQYKFAGEGLGVPGLPHTLSMAEAAALGVLDVLLEAIDNGTYQLIEQPTEA